MYCFNPFFIRASVYWENAWNQGTLNMARFQSLLHQGISLLVENAVLTISLLFGFQSLLHPGISLLLAGIPTHIWMRWKMFQSLLHQGISLLLI